MIPRRRVLAGLAACALPFPARAEDLTGGEILETATGKALSFTDLLDRLEQADTILIGERHGFAPHQDRVALILEELALRGRFPTLALEMLEPAQMPALDTYRQENPEYVGGLGAALNWSESGWPSWHFYEPIFRAAFRAKLEIVAADRDDGAPRPAQSTSLPVLEEYWRALLQTGYCLNPSEPLTADRARTQAFRDITFAGHLARRNTLALVGRDHIAPLSTWLRPSGGLTTLRFSDPVTRRTSPQDYLWHAADEAPREDCQAG